LQAIALERGLGVYPLSPLFAVPPSPVSARPAGLILGYAGLTTQDIQDGIRILAEVIREVMGETGARAG